ncbi:MAG: NAD(+) synthase [Deltaproteobacteria bacterium]|nr:NAD(+) synthase [Deltaproteobacteria bacterium]RLA91268.1 MAG: NAD(+) synthase [Deltaproteobacteria bacterium]
MDNNTKLRELKSQIKINPEKVSIALENFIREYMEKLEREGVIFGLSGGIDSAVVATLCKNSVGEEKCLALIMPEKDSKKEHIEDAINFAKKLNIETKLINITPYLKELGVYKLFSLSKIPFFGKLKEMLLKKAYNFYENKTGDNPFSSSILGFKGKQFSYYLKRGNAYYRIKHRIRMVLLYLYAEVENRLVAGAANKSEYKIGFFVKHGCDDAADIMPIINLYKTQVRQLAQYLNIPERIISKPPSPDIIPGIIDEEAIGIPYKELDIILLALEKGLNVSDIAKLLEIEGEKVIYIKNLIQKSEHMRKTYKPKDILSNGRV